MLFHFKTSLLNCLEIFNKREIVNDSMEVWDDIVTNILSFIPLDHARECLKPGIKVITTVMQDILNLNPDIDFTVDANYMADNLCARYADDAYVLRFKTNIVIKFRIIQAFFEVISKDYGTAFFSFRWILQFISSVRSKFPNDLNATFINSSEISWVVRQVSLYLSKCLNLDFNQKKRIKYVSSRCVRVNRLDLFKGILYTILENSNDCIPTQDDFMHRHITAEYFKVCAEIYEAIALLDGKLINYEQADDLKVAVIMPQRMFSIYMTRHYMIAAQHYTVDDPNRLVCFHKILMGLFFVNRIEIETYNFFYSQLRECAKNIKDSHISNDYSNFPLSGTFVNIINSVGLRRHTLKFLPTVLIRLATNEVIMDSEFSSESICRPVCTKEAGKLKRKVLGSNYDDNDHIGLEDMSTYDLISFWKQIKM